MQNNTHKILICVSILKCYSCLNFIVKKQSAVFSFAGRFFSLCVCLFVVILNKTCFCFVCYHNEPIKEEDLICRNNFDKTIILCGNQTIPYTAYRYAFIFNLSVTNKSRHVAVFTTCRSVKTCKGSIDFDWPA